MKLKACFAVFLCSWLSSIACAAPSNDEWMVERSEWHWDLDSIQAVDIRNPWGDVRVRVDDKQQAYLLSNAQRHRDDPRQLELLVTETDGTLSIEVKLPEDEIPEATETWDFRRVDVTLLIPAKTRLSCETSSGLAEVRGLIAPLKVNTDTGDIRLRLNGPVTAYSNHGMISSLFLDTKQPSTLETLTGLIHVAIANGGNADVALQTHGWITTDYSVDIERDQNTDFKKAHAIVGNNGPKLTLTSNRGPIRLLGSTIPRQSLQEKH